MNDARIAIAINFTFFLSNKKFSEIQGRSREVLLGAIALSEQLFTFLR
jgi:hypothetical protein